MDKCPMCGWTETSNNKPQNNAMNKYILKSNPKTVVILNDSKETVEHKKEAADGSTITLTYIRKDVFDAPQKSEPKQATIVSDPNAPISGTLKIG